jgi:hypothetical protein
MIDNDILEQARNADLLAFLGQRRGFTFTRSNGAYRCLQHPSLAIKGDRSSFYWHSKGIGGFGTLDYMVKVENMPFRDAVVLCSRTAATATLPPAAGTAHSPAGQQKTLDLPEKRDFPVRLYDYLCCKRGIDSEIVQTLIQKGMLYEDKRGNAVFVGFDEHGAARFASLRGMCGDFRGDCAGSDKRYGFCMASPRSDQVYIFESPIDAMSHGSLDNAFRGRKDAWERINRLSLAGTGDAAVPFFLNQHKAVAELVFCLDNDPAGRDVAANMARKYAAKGYRVRIELPAGKDFNEDLLSLTKCPSRKDKANDER